LSAIPFGMRTAAAKAGTTALPIAASLSSRWGSPYGIPHVGGSILCRATASLVAAI
jgi:hypothetical protein